ncbi:MAG: NAD-dependent epimerase/dehydratase family protein [Elusimicrobiota bacterium]
MKYLITGGCGFVGSNLAEAVINKNEELIILDNLYRYGSEKNLKWLKSKAKFKFYKTDIRDYSKVSKIIKDAKPDVIFHLAGQVAMTTSLKEPYFDFEVNAKGSLNVLEAVRLYSPNSIVLYSSTNKVYGDLEQFNYKETETRYICKEYPKGFPENIPLDFHSPYGCSKGSADQYMLDYSRMFGLKTVVFRHSSMYGGRQFATYDQGWVGWFCQKAIEIKNGKLKEPFTISGTGKQVRDVLYCDDVVDLYFEAIKNIEKAKGKSFNIGAGYENSLSLIELFQFLEEKLDIKMEYKKLPFRESDQKVFIADISKAKNKIGWTPKVSAVKGIYRMIEWLENV